MILVITFLFYAQHLSNQNKLSIDVRNIIVYYTNALCVLYYCFLHVSCCVNFPRKLLTIWYNQFNAESHFKDKSSYSK